eukprot:8707383-Ditylum_brightwellii.AAC.1
MQGQTHMLLCTLELYYHPFQQPNRTFSGSIPKLTDDDSLDRSGKGRKLTKHDRDSRETD